MHFQDLHDNPQQKWMEEAIRDSLNAELSAGPALKVYAKEQIDFLIWKDSFDMTAAAKTLGIAKLIYGSFRTDAHKLFIEAHIVDQRSWMMDQSYQVEGEEGDFTNLQMQLAWKIKKHFNIAESPKEQGGRSLVPSASNEAYKQLLEAEGEVPQSGSPQQGDPHPPDRSGKEEDKHSH